MPVWSNCRIEVVTCDGEPPFVDDDCDVRIDADAVAVSYFDDQGPVVFVGSNDGSGHFELACRSRPRRATLHMFPDGTVLEGSWVENDVRGFHRILLGHVPAAGDGGGTATRGGEEGET